MPHSTKLFAACLVALLALAAYLRLTRPIDRTTLVPGQTNYAIDLNSADAPTLALLPGIGPNLAQRIVEHRAKHGAFQSVHDLDDVRGIGDRTADRLKPYVKCDAIGTAAATTRPAP